MSFNIFQRAFSILFTTLLFTNLHAQYAPAAGQAGSTAIWKDSSAFVAWAQTCVVSRGYQNIADTKLGYATAGNDTMAIGYPSVGTVSLGDGGSAICTFTHPIRNGAGFDFAVFENSFDGLFLELAVVEVSSNGIDFVRFAAHSLTDTAVQKGTFDLLDATQLNNLAGKYSAGYGTPFDLAELAGNPMLDVENITHIKVTDVVGSIDASFATRDAFGNKINDPFPTSFEACGFDLSAIGVIHHNNPSALANNLPEQKITVYPNPASRLETLRVISKNVESMTLKDVLGRTILTSTNNEIHLNETPQGLYYLQFSVSGKLFSTSIIVQ
jgi:hypothetical protein